MAQLGQPVRWRISNDLADDDIAPSLAVRAHQKASFYRPSLQFLPPKPPRLGVVTGDFQTSMIERWLPRRREVLVRGYWWTSDRTEKSVVDRLV